MCAYTHTNTHAHVAYSKYMYILEFYAYCAYRMVF